MKKRIISLALAGLLALALCVPALASGEDYFERSWDMALYLQNAACVRAESEMELSGTVGGAVGMDVSVDMWMTEAAYQNGDRLTLVEYDTYEPNSVMVGNAIFQSKGSAYFVSADKDDDNALVKYTSVREDTFGDLSQLCLYFAALGDNEMGAAVAPADSGSDLTYETTGAEIKKLLDVCCPALLKGYDEAALSGASVQVQVQFDIYTDECGADITITCPQIGEAMLKQLEGVESVTDADLTIYIDVEGLSKNSDDYEEYLITDEVLAEAEEEYGTPVTEQDGEAPLCETAKDFLWSIYEPGYTMTVGRESAKDALRAALHGGDQTVEETDPTGKPAE